MTAIESRTLPVEPALAPPVAGAPWQVKRLWFPILAVLAYWAFIVVQSQMDLVMFVRFISRMIALLLLFVLFHAWWVTNGGVRLRDRLLMWGAALGIWLATGFISDKTMNHFVLVLSGVPVLLTAWTLWLLVSRRWTLNAQRLGLGAVMLLSFGFFAFFRWDGLNGAQETKLSWRLSPTPEELFLKERGANSNPGETIPAAPWTVQPGDWPEFRGSLRDGIAPAIPQQNWKDAPPRLAWKRRVGPAWSSVIIVDGHLVTQEQRGEQEALVCYDAASGNELWAHEEPLRFTEGLSGDGPRATPTFHDGRIFSYGATGKLCALEAATGKLLWAHDVLKETGGAVPQWGLSVSPLVVDDLVIVFAGGPGEQGIVAYQAATGERAWTAKGGTQSYSSPQLATLAGRRQVLVHDNASLKAFQPEDGNLLWERPGSSAIFAPMLQPHVLDDRRLLLHTEEGMALIEVSEEAGKLAAADLWKSLRLKPEFNDFVIHQGAIFGFDDGILCCLDLATGERKWKKGRYGHGQLLLVPEQNLLVVMGEQGEAALVAADPGKFVELGRISAIAGKTWNHPVIAHNQLFVRNGEEMACFELLPAGQPLAARSADKDR